jgi:cell division protein FtsW (lipid II flippase)
LTNTVAIDIQKIARVVPRKRNIEIWLLFFAYGINAFELAQIQLSTIEILTFDILTYWAPLAVAATALHIILRVRASEADALILPAVVLLNGLGIAQIYRLDLATIAAGGTELFAFRQVIWTVVAIAAASAVVLFVRSHLFLRRYVYISMVVGLVLLISPVLPFIGTSINGAQLWISIGGLTFQPGELAKIALTIFFAGYLVTRRDSLAAVGPKFVGIQLPRARDLGPILAIWAVSLLVLIGQRDLGTSLLYFGLFMVMIYVATGRAIYVVVGLGMFITSALVASQVLS